VLPGVVVVLIGIANGGFFPRSWGWSAIALAALAGAATLLRDRIVLYPLEGVTLAAVSALAGWTAFSIIWSSSPTDSLLEAERTLVYVAGLAACVFVIERRDVSVLLGGILTAATSLCVYGLVTRLYPEGPIVADPFEGTLLIEPLGYANALGLLAALAAVLALSFAAHAARPLARAGVAASVPLFVAVLVFTESRGSWLALAAGVAVAVVLDTRRGRLLAATVALAVPAVVVVWLASRATTLTSGEATVAMATGQGHRFAVALALLAVASAVGALAAGRLAPGRSGRWPLLVGGVLLAAAVVLVAYRVATTPGLAGNRPAYWRVAWHEVEANPVLGSGAGTFALSWLHEQPAAEGVRDAHSLYLETLAELGPVGLLLLVAILAPPLGAAVVAREHSLVPGAAAAYSAYVVHAGLDWDWEMPAVTLAGLFCAAAVLAAARPAGGGRRLAPAARLALVAAAAAVAGLAFAGLVDNGLLTL